MSKLIPSKTPLRLPEVVETSFTNQTSWVIFEYFPGDILAYWQPNKNFTQLPSRLQQIVDILMFFDNLDPDNIHLSNDPNLSIPINEQFKAQMDSWSQQPKELELLKDTELSNLIEIIQSVPLSRRLQHGDFVPWHMFGLNSAQIGLVDSEHGSTQKSRFYDLAYFYQRIFTKLDPDLAKQFLQIFLDRSADNKNQFFLQFLPVIAVRAIGGMFDYARADYTLDDERKTEKQLHRQLLELILQKDLNSLLS